MTYLHRPTYRTRPVLEFKAREILIFPSGSVAVPGIPTIGLGNNQIAPSHSTLASPWLTEGAALGSSEKFGFVPCTLMNPLFVEVGALDLGRESRLQDYLAAQGRQPGNKEGRAPSATTAMITTRAMAGS